MAAIFRCAILFISLILNYSDSAVERGRIFRPSDCEDLYQIGMFEDGVYTIYPRGSRRGVKVYCDMTTDGGGWTVFQRRFDGSVDFYRNWEEYAEGFGDANGEYWLGNDHLNELTSQGDYKLRIDMEDFDGVWKYAMYSTFDIGNHELEYKLLIGSYSGTAGDSLAYQDGRTFMTKDHGANSCPMRWHGAWWYLNCAHSNLNGRYNGTGNGGINWKTWHGTTYSLKTVEMKTRRI